MPTLKQIVEQSDTRLGRAFDLTIQALIVVSLVSFSLDTLPNLPGWALRLLSVVEVMTVAAFTVEYLLRLLLADSKPRFAFSFFGIVDLLAILPFYVAAGVDMRSVRAFRMFRLFSILKLTRYSRAMRRFHRAFASAKEEVVLFSLGATLMLYLSAVGIYYFENAAQPEAFASVFHSLWWAVCTLTTVGYGDVYPITTGGKLFTFAVLAIGLGIVAVPAGLVATALSRAREFEQPASAPPAPHFAREERPADSYNNA